MEVKHTYEEIQIYILKTRGIVVNNSKYNCEKVFRFIYKTKQTVEAPYLFQRIKQIMTFRE